MAESREFVQATDEPDVAESLLRNEGEWDVSIDRLSAADGSFSFTARQLVHPDVVITRNSADGRFCTRGTADTFGVATVTGGGFDWEVDGVRGRATDAPLLLQPEHATLCRIDGLEVTNVYMRAPVLEALARTVYGRDDIRVAFSSPAPIDAAHGTYFADLVRYTNVAVRSGAFQNELVRAALVRNLGVAMLQAYPLVGDPSVRAFSAGRADRLYRGATEFLRSHASLPITADDAAHALECSRAELDAAFQARAMMTAGEYLALVRLNAAHEDLLVGDPGVLNVVTVAHRWGFPSERAFTRRYRGAYGRMPHETLRT